MKISRAHMLTAALLALLFGSGCLGPVWVLYEVTKPEKEESNDAPVVDVTDPGRTFDLTSIPIDFSLADPNGDGCSVSCAWSTDAGATWNQCSTIIGTTAGLAPGSSYGLTWDAGADLPGGVTTGVLIGVTAYDGTDASVRGTAGPFIAGNSAPAVITSLPVGATGANIVIDYTLEDEVADTCSVLFEYSTDGSNWFTCDPASGIAANPETGIVSGAVPEAHSFTWDSLSDLGAVNIGAQVRITATDGGGASGTDTTVLFIIKNNQSPAVTFLSGPVIILDTSGIIPILYRIKDAETDACTVLLHWSTDSGVSWNACTEYPVRLSEGKSGLASYVNMGDEALGEHLFMWNSVDDLGRRDAYCELRLMAIDATGNLSVEVFKSLTVSNFSAVKPADPQTWAVGGPPSDTVMADVNGDGCDDIITAVTSADQIVIALGSPTGPAAPTILGTGAGPRVVTAGDFDNDGFADIVTGNESDDNLTYFRGAGAGLVLVSNLACGLDPVALAVGDFDDDTYDDLVVAHSSGGSTDVYVYMGGVGGLTGPGTIAVGFNQGDIEAADFNGDGIDDMVCSHPNDGWISVSSGSGGGLIGAVMFAAGTRPNQLATGDINGDGIADIACSVGTDMQIRIWRGVFGGGFLTDTVDLADNSWKLVMIDMNADGYDEVIAETGVPFTPVYIIAGSPSGPGAVKQIEASSEIIDLTAADFNGDGFGDFAAANGPANDVTMCFGSGSGNYGTGLAGAGAYPYGITAGDVNGDGYPDLAVALPNDSEVAFLAGQAGLPVNVRTLDGELAPWGITAGDIDRDGLNEIVWGNNGSDSISICQGTKAGPGNVQHIAAGANPWMPSMADINGDGYADIVCPNSQDDTVSLYMGGSGGAGAEQVLNAGTEPWEAVLANMDGDGYLDIGVVNYDPGELTINLGTAGGAAPGPLSVVPGGQCTSIATGDIDADGFADLATTDSSSNSFITVLGDATWPWVGQAWLTQADPYDVVLADINGDGYDDGVTCNGTANSFTLYLGGASGIVPGPAHMDLTPLGAVAPYTMISGDFNADGYADIASACMGSAQIAVSLGSPAGLQAPYILPAGTNPFHTAAADLNGDGYMDIMCPNQFSNDITVCFGGPNGLRHTRTLIAGSFPDRTAGGDVTGDGCSELLVTNYMSNDVMVFSGDIIGTTKSAVLDTAGGAVTVHLCRVEAVFPQNSFSQPQPITLAKASEPVRLPLMAAKRPVPASFAWELMRMEVTLDSGVASLTLPFAPNVSDARITGSDFRLYRFHPGADIFDPSDDVVEVVATTEGGGALTKDAAARTVTADVDRFGRYQIFQVIP